MLTVGEQARLIGRRPFLGQQMVGPLEEIRTAAKNSVVEDLKLKLASNIHKAALQIQALLAAAARQLEETVAEAQITWSDRAKSALRLAVGLGPGLAWFTFVGSRGGKAITKLNAAKKIGDGTYAIIQKDWYGSGLQVKAKEVDPTEARLVQIGMNALTDRIAMAETAIAEWETEIPDYLIDKAIASYFASYLNILDDAIKAIEAAIAALKALLEAIARVAETAAELPGWVLLAGVGAAISLGVVAVLT